MARNFQRGPRMAKNWDTLGQPSTPIVLTATVTGVDAGTLARDESWTVIRMIGEYLIVPAGAPVAGDHCSVGVGIAVVSSDAVAVGGSAMPDPLVDLGYPWLYWKAHMFNFQDSSGDIGGRGTAVRVPFDIKTMRKVKPQETLAFIFEYIDGAGAPAMDLTPGLVRVLVAR